MALRRLRIGQFDGRDGESVAEIECSGIERKTGEVRPEIELIAGSTAGEAAEEVAIDVYGEAASGSRLG